MKIIKLITCIFAFTPLLTSAQQKITTTNSTTTEKFNYQPLKESINVDAKFEENYKKGTEHYNNAVKIIKSAAPEIALADLEALEKKSAEQFNLALPYFKRAYEINPKDKNTLQGLMGVSFGLNDIANYTRFKKEFQALK
jgi:tetratricopeptide (TPR) repeat protein